MLKYDMYEKGRGVKPGFVFTKAHSSVPVYAEIEHAYLISAKVQVHVVRRGAEGPVVRDLET
jgi:hypothetical protein